MTPLSSKILISRPDSASHKRACRRYAHPSLFFSFSLFFFLLSSSSLREGQKLSCVFVTILFPSGEKRIARSSSDSHPSPPGNRSFGPCNSTAESSATFNTRTVPFSLCVTAHFPGYVRKV